MDRIALECPLPMLLEPIERHGCTTPAFGGYAECFFRVDKDGQLWRRTGRQEDDLRFDWSGTLEVDTRVNGDYARFTMTFEAGKAVAFGALLVAKPPWRASPGASQIAEAAAATFATGEAGRP
jgi:hypothetical protein